MKTDFFEYLYINFIESFIVTTTLVDDIIRAKMMWYVLQLEYELIYHIFIT